MAHYFLFNETTGNPVSEDDTHYTMYGSMIDAIDALDEANDLKKLDPIHCNDKIIIKQIKIKNI